MLYNAMQCLACMMVDKTLHVAAVMNMSETDSQRAKQVCSYMAL